MNKKTKVLITNDDGIHAKGIHHLWKTLVDTDPNSNNTSNPNLYSFDPYIVAPSEEKSACGLSITAHSPLYFKKVKWENNSLAWSVSGTPADCIKMGVNLLPEHYPDIIVSGINRGNNSGKNLLYSGTVGGIIEGIFQGIPGIAFSWDYGSSPCEKITKKYIPQIIQYVLTHPFPVGTFLNVNFPTTAENKVKGFKLTRQGRQFFCEKINKRSHPDFDTHHYYWLGCQQKEFEEHDNSDITLLKQGYITATPIHVEELTDHQQLKERKEHFESFIKH